MACSPPQEVGPVLGRSQVKTRKALMRDEFGESLDHLRLGAAHAAGTAAAMLEPRLDQVRERLEPTYERSKKKVRGTVRGSSRKADRIARRATRQNKDARRWPVLLGGLVVAGAAAGIVGAILARRRQHTWNEYGTTERETGFGTDREFGRDTGRETHDTRSFSEGARATASSATDGVKEKASDVLGQMKDVSEPTGGAATSSPRAGGAATSSSRPGRDFVGNETRNGVSGSRTTRP
jgi:hypothetical protein